MAIIPSVKEKTMTKKRQSEPDLFGINESIRRKHDGMLAAEYGGKHLVLKDARRIAKQIAMLRLDKTVTADDVNAALIRIGITESLGNAAGSLFRGSEWQFTGERIKSARKTNHAREIKVWRYLGA